jgi:nucleoside-diphosphate-sugar epimerase
MSGNQKLELRRSPKRLDRPRILIVGCGDVGRRIARLLQGRFTVFGTMHQGEQAAALRAAGIVPVQADLDDPMSLARLAHLAHWVMHLAPPAPHGSRDLRTRHLVSVLGDVRRLVYISTSGVYGDCGGARIDETGRPHPETPRAARRLDAECTLRHWARRNRAGLAILRVPGIYAEDRLPIARLRAGTPALIAAEDVYTNHIHAEDLARISIAALWRGAPLRIYHASDDSGLRMGEYFDLVADHLGLARPPRVTRAVLAESVTAASYSFMRESRRLANERIKSELSIALRYPHVVDGLCAASDQAPRLDDERALS